MCGNGCGGSSRTNDGDPCSLARAMDGDRRSRRRWRRMCSPGCGGSNDGGARGMDGGSAEAEAEAEADDSPMLSRSRLIKAVDGENER
jgi:hypothetical protein